MAINCIIYILKIHTPKNNNITQVIKSEWLFRLIASGFLLSFYTFNTSKSNNKGYISLKTHNL